jgi:mono/diheme cytochrome c family protein
MKNMTRKTLSAAGVLALQLLCTPAHVEAFDRGRALYENHCMECHESWAHAREGRRVNSKNALRQRVAGWSMHIGLGWSDEEIDDVADYLDRNFYHFAE